MFGRHKKLAVELKNLEIRLTQAEYFLNYYVNLMTEGDKGTQKSIATLLNKICKIEKKIGE